MTEGAVYMPFERLPTEGVDHVTAVLVVPFTVAVNCVLCDAMTVAFAGLRITLILLGTSWTTAVPDLEESTTLVALMVTVCGLVITEGAVYIPFDRLPTDGLMDQVTPVLVVPVTVGVN